MVNFQEAKVKLTNIQLNKLKSAGKCKKKTILRLTKKNLKIKNHRIVSNNKANN